MTRLACELAQRPRGFPSSDAFLIRYMAVTQSTPQPQERRPWTSLDGESEGEKVENWFERVVWHDHLICSGCFARLQVAATDERDDWGHETTQTWRTDDAIIAQDVIPKSEVGQRATRHPDGRVDGVEPIDVSTSTYAIVPRTTCTQCGSIGGRADPDPLSEQAAVDRVPALVERLRERGYSVDVGTVYFIVRKFKTDSERTADDKAIFATAAAMGLTRA